MAGLLGRLAGDLGVTVGVAGLTLTVLAVAYVTGAPPLDAPLSTRIPRRVLIGSLVLFGRTPAPKAGDFQFGDRG